MLFYGFVLAAMLILLAVLCRYAADHPELLHPNATPESLEALARQISPGVGLYFSVFALGIAAPHVAAFGYLAVAILAVLSPRVGALG